MQFPLIKPHPRDKDVRNINEIQLERGEDGRVDYALILTGGTWYALRIVDGLPMINGRVVSIYNLWDPFGNWDK